MSETREAVIIRLDREEAVSQEIREEHYCDTDMLLDAMLVFLDELRESAVTNMLGAAPYLMVEFKMSRKAASLVVLYWRILEERLWR